MGAPYFYPPDLARFARDHWPAGRTLNVSHEHLCEALTASFHASLTSEESRPTRFRLLLTPPEALPEHGVPNEGVLRLAFDHTRAATPDELRQLAPSAPFETTLIGVHAFDGRCASGGWRTRGRPGWPRPGGAAASSRTGRTIRSST